MGFDIVVRNILFRADAKPSIGTGDLMSLIQLSRYFENGGWQSHFIIKGCNAAVEIIKKHKVKNFLIVDEDISVGKEVKELNNYIESKKIDVIFFEITERPLTEYKGISDKAIKACVNFDGVIPDDMSLVIDWDVNADKLFDPQKYPNTKFLLGLDYVILPIDFDFNKINRRAYRDEPRTLLISMGGADEFDFTQKIIDILIKEGINLKLNVVIGGGYMYTEKLEASLKNSNIRYKIKQNITNMFDEYMNCDIAVAAGGLTAFELIATRTPSFLVAIYKHQIERCAYFDKMGWAKYLGFRSFDGKTLLKSIQNPVADLPERVFKTGEIRSCVDGFIQRH